MGAWGVGPFDNDASGDVLDEVAGSEASQRVALIKAKLHGIADAAGRLDSWETEQALALAALVAASLGGLETQHPTAVEFLNGYSVESDTALRELALRVIDRALTADDNEWYELWVTSDGLDEARQALMPFRTALA